MPLNPADVQAYTTEVEETLKARIVQHTDRFPDNAKLLRNFEGVRASASERGLRAFDEIHNEVLVALSLLESEGREIQALRYEPALLGTAKTIDFRAEFKDSRVAYIDVKSIIPKAIDKWDQFEQAQEENWMPPTAGILLDKELLGGELWHYGAAARSRMLEHTVELEAKIEYALRSDPSALFCLALCSMAFHWSRDELEDFAGFYRRGQHRSDDPYARMEAKYIQGKGIILSQKVDSFAYLERKQFEIEASEMIWRVAPPPLPF